MEEEEEEEKREEGMKAFLCPGRGQFLEERAGRRGRSCRDYSIGKEATCRSPILDFLRCLLRAIVRYT